jgi:hypothetical protein
MPLPLSVAIVCKDSEPTIGRTLGSVAGLASEIVALDSGSTDGTIGVLESHGARVERVEWRGFLKTKQAALEACVHPWVLLLDSDESPDEAMCAAIRSAIERDDASVGGYELNRMTWYAGRPLRHVWQPEWILRLVRREQGRHVGVDPHPHIEVTSGSVGRLAGTLRHDSFGSILEHLSRQVSYARDATEALSARGQRGSVARVLISPTGAMFKQIVLKSGWRDGWRGWVAAGSSASATLMKHLVLLERSRGGPGESPGPDA